MSNTKETKEIAAIKNRVMMEEWRQEIESRQASGLSVKEWCAQKGVSTSGYYHRLRRLRETVCEQFSSAEPEQPAIVPIKRPGAPVIEMESNGIRIIVPTECPAELVCAMLRELKV